MHISLLLPCHGQHTIYHIAKSCRPPSKPIMRHLANLSPILLIMMSLFLLAYALVHHPNFLTHRCELTTKAIKVYGLPVQLAKYVNMPSILSLPMAPQVDILTFSPT